MVEKGDTLENGMQLGLRSARKSKSIMLLFLT